MPQPLSYMTTPTQAGHTPSHPLTVADGHCVLVVVAVVDAPAGETALLDARLVAGAGEVVHPDLTGAALTICASDAPDSVSEIQHPGRRKREKRGERGVG